LFRKTKPFSPASQAFHHILHLDLRSMSYYPDDVCLPSLAFPPVPLLSRSCTGQYRIFVVLLTKLESLSIYRFLAETICLSLPPLHHHPSSILHPWPPNGSESSRGRISLIHLLSLFILSRHYSLQYRYSEDLSCTHCVYQHILHTPGHPPEVSG
jgi:hypothetical protein